MCLCIGVCVCVGLCVCVGVCACVCVGVFVCWCVYALGYRKIPKITLLMVTDDVITLKL